MKKLMRIGAIISLFVFSLIFMSGLVFQQTETEETSDFYFAPERIVIRFTGTGLKLTIQKVFLLLLMKREFTFHGIDVTEASGLTNCPEGCLTHCLLFRTKVSDCT